MCMTRRYEIKAYRGIFIVYFKYKLDYWRNKTYFITINFCFLLTTAPPINYFTYLKKYN